MEKFCFNSNVFTRNEKLDILEFKKVFKLENKPVENQFNKQAELISVDEVFVDEDVSTFVAPSNFTIIILKIDIIFNKIYNVPAFYFNLTDEHGQIFKIDNEYYRNLVFRKDSSNLLISQEDHPIYNVPYYFLHPCNTNATLNLIFECNPAEVENVFSVKKLKFWLSLIQQHLKIKIIDLKEI